MSPTSVGAADEKRIKETEGSESLAALAVHRRKRGSRSGKRSRFGFQGGSCGYGQSSTRRARCRGHDHRKWSPEFRHEGSVGFPAWYHALPGHRASSVHAKVDPRIDFARLQRACGNKIPTEREGGEQGVVSFVLVGNLIRLADETETRNASILAMLLPYERSLQPRLSEAAAE